MNVGIMNEINNWRKNIMAKTHVVYIVKENDKLYACDATIEIGGK